jgi:hypothetical protein
MIASKILSRYVEAVGCVALVAIGAWACLADDASPPRSKGSGDGSGGSAGDSTANGAGGVAGNAPSGGASGSSGSSGSQSTGGRPQ